VNQETEKFKKTDSKELEDFANYLGVDFEDLYELHYNKKCDDIDFDDWSR